MKKKILSFLCAVIIVGFAPRAEAFSLRHHLARAAVNLGKMAVAPLEGVFVTGPKNIREAYTYEAYETENPEDRSKLFAIWRAPGEELKGALDGVVNTVDYARKFLWELISIPFSD